MPTITLQCVLFVANNINIDGTNMSRLMSGLMNVVCLFNRYSVGNHCDQVRDVVLSYNGGRMVLRFMYGQVCQCLHPLYQQTAASCNRIIDCGCWIYAMLCAERLTNRTHSLDSSCFFFSSSSFYFFSFLSVCVTLCTVIPLNGFRALCRISFTHSTI